MLVAAEMCSPSYGLLLFLHPTWICFVYLPCNTHYKLMEVVVQSTTVFRGSGL